MKQKVLLLVLCLVLFGAVAQRSEAHVLQKSGSVGAVLHVSPEDDPIVGEQSGFFFEFKDKEGKFKPGNCTCTVIILEDGKEVYTQLLFENNPNPSLSDASFSYTFPEKNIYQLKVVGRPKSQPSFAPFTLVYDIRVARESEPSTSLQKTKFSLGSFLSGHIPHTIIAVVTLILVWYFLFKKK